MKITTLSAATLLLCFPASPVRAQEPPPAPAPPPAKCEMCEMMMKKKAAARPQMNEQIAELDKLVTEMNGSLGPRKIEAMAAIVTRLVAQHKMMAAAKPAPPRPPAPPPAAPPKEEAHQH